MPRQSRKKAKAVRQHVFDILAGEQEEETGTRGGVRGDRSQRDVVDAHSQRLTPLQLMLANTHSIYMMLFLCSSARKNQHFSQSGRRDQHQKLQTTASPHSPSKKRSV